MHWWRMGQTSDFWEWRRELHLFVFRFGAFQGSSGKNRCSLLVSPLQSKLLILFVFFHSAQLFTIPPLSIKNGSNIFSSDLLYQDICPVALFIFLF